MSPGRHRSRSPRPLHGFTLIELLIVVAIIALLVTILTPSLKRARDMALNVQCLTNLRSLGLNVGIYASEYEGRAPINNANVNGGLNPDSYWDRLLWRYATGRKWQSPKPDPFSPSGLFQCPFDETESYEGTRDFVSYANSNNQPHIISKSYYSSGKGVPMVEVYSVDVNGVRQGGGPSDVAYLVDAHYARRHHWPRCPQGEPRGRWGQNWNACAASEWYDCHHPRTDLWDDSSVVAGIGRPNALFFDLHVKLLEEPLVSNDERVLYDFE
jgi:prepilin-type N-terminal cleavage/methylation domain-containing protein